MTWLISVLAALALLDSAAAAPETPCSVPESFLSADSDLTQVAKDIKLHQRLDISVIGTGSSSLPGPDGASFAYPAQLEQSLKQQLPNVTVKVTAHVQARETTPSMAASLGTVLSEDKPALVIWQAGTVDAMQAVDIEDFRISLEHGIDAIQNHDADVILVNMQYSPRTEAMINVSNYADVMRIVAQQHGAVLFDRLGIMRDWSENGVFDLYAATNNYDMARRVHACIGRGLASQIIAASHLDTRRTQTTE